MQASLNDDIFLLFNHLLILYGEYIAVSELHIGFIFNVKTADNHPALVLLLRRAQIIIVTCRALLQSPIHQGEVDAGKTRKLSVNSHCRFLD